MVHECSDLAEWLSYLIHFRHLERGCLTRDDPKKRVLGFKPFGKMGVTYTLPISRVVDRTVWFKDSPPCKWEQRRTAKYTKFEILEALGTSSRDLSELLRDPGSREILYGIQPACALDIRSERIHVSLRSWLDVLAASKAAGHSLLSRDSPVSQHIGFYDDTAKVWHKVGVSSAKEGGADASLIRTAPGRRTLIEGC